MISYPFISDLFTSILSKSRTIEGRFYVCPKMGYEINSDVLGQVLTDIQPAGKKYPLVLMMPPRSNDQLYYITLFFLKTSYYGTGTNINPNTNTSIDSLQSDWHEMRIASDSFLFVLNQVAKNDSFQHFGGNGASVTTTPVSEIGIDRASGVRIDFQITMRGIICEPLEDYNESDIELITVPV